VSKKVKGDAQLPEDVDAKSDLKLYGGLVLVALILTVIGLIFSSERHLESDRPTTPAQGIDPLGDPADLAIIAADDEQQARSDRSTRDAAKKPDERSPTTTQKTGPASPGEVRPKTQSDAMKDEERDRPQIVLPSAAE
jgi:hypothetical protein